MIDFAVYLAGLASGLVLAFFFRDKELVDQAVNGNDMVPRNPNPEYIDSWEEREARRVERPLEERSVPGIVVRVDK